MKLYTFLIHALFFLSFNNFASATDINNSNYFFNGKVYSIYIKSQCQGTLVCDKLTGRFIIKDDGKSFVINNGKTINTGFQDNLRGFVFTENGLDYTLLQPASGDISRWLFTINKKGVYYIDEEASRSLYFERGDMAFLR